MEVKYPGAGFAADLAGPILKRPLTKFRSGRRPLSAVLPLALKVLRVAARGLGARLWAKNRVEKTPVSC